MNQSLTSCGCSKDFLAAWWGPDHSATVQRLWAACPQDFLAFVDWNLDPGQPLPWPRGGARPAPFESGFTWWPVQGEFLRLDLSPAEFLSLLDVASGGPGCWAPIRAALLSRP